MKSKAIFSNRISCYLTWVAIGLVASAVALYTQGCAGPPLKPWHTENLTEEFTADMADKIQTFDEYRQLEDRLFAQLEEKVYLRTATGPEYALVRYSAGSAADPQLRRPNWNRSFELSADRPVGGVLLLHGMSDSPYSLRALGETLKQRDYWVIGLRLPGHGTAPSGLKHISWQDMAAAVRLSMMHLGSKLGQKPIHIVGYSTGAPLAINFALDAFEGNALPAPASLVLISPAIGIHASAALAKWKRRLSYLPGLGGLAWLSVLPEFDPYKYNSFATNENPVSRSVVSRRKPPFSVEASKSEALNLAWPRGVISLSHVALPFPPDDPLYGQVPPGKEDILFLGQMAIQGERDLLKIPYSFLVRLRYNPFYAFLETRALEWFAKGIS